MRNEFSQIFPHLNDHMLEWAPSAGMRSIHGQFVEILGTEAEIIDILEGLPTKEIKDLNAAYWAIKSVAELMEQAHELRAKTLEILEKYDESQLNAPVKISKGYAAYLGLDSVPAAELFRFIVRHESYHAGQLFSYLWARGDNPYQWS